MKHTFPSLGLSVAVNIWDNVSTQHNKICNILQYVIRGLVFFRHFIVEVFHIVPLAVVGIRSRPLEDVFCYFGPLLMIWYLGLINLYVSSHICEVIAGLFYVVEFFPVSCISFIVFVCTCCCVHFNVKLFELTCHIQMEFPHLACDRKQNVINHHVTSVELRICVPCSGITFVSELPRLVFVCMAGQSNSTQMS